MFKKIVSVLLCITLLASAGSTLPASAEVKSAASQTASELNYQRYIADKDLAPANASIVINATDYTSASGTSPEAEVIDGKEALATYDESTVEWTVSVESAGLYDVSLLYYPLEGKGSTIERILYIDGEVPFAEAKSLYFTRSWVNQGDKLYTSSGNEYRRAQIEDRAWTETQLHSKSGYEDSDLGIYLSKGKHTIALEAVTEPMAIAQIHLYTAQELPTYEEKQQSYQENGYTAATAPYTYEAEDATRKSASTLYAVEDRTSPANSPYDEAKILLNCIGSTNWEYKGQWIEWQIDVPESGLYTLSMRTKQDYVSGANATRRLYIDGEIPFQEAENVEVSYDLGWQMVTIGGDEPYHFYFTAGTHTLRLEVVIGDLASVLYDVNQTVQSLNTIYRNVLAITGSFPDSLRDYDLEANIPDLFATINSCITELEEAEARLEELSGGKGEQSVYIDQMLVQLRNFVKHPDTIPDGVSDLNDNINALISWVVSAAEVPLLIDYFVLSPADTQLPQAEAGFFERVWSSIKSFALSFVIDYYSVESFTDVEANNGEITLWLSGGSGRDQATIIKNLSDNYFTRSTGIALNLKLVDMDVLLRAVASGNGPDVAIFQSQATPMNYGVRGALYDLSTFDDVDEVCARFAESALTPFRLGASLYALPEQQVFPMLFYRTDILEELGVSYPQTWDELYKIITVLQEQNMEIGLPTPVNVQSGSDTTGINSVFAALLMQNNCRVYDEDNRLCTLNDVKAVDCFIQWSEFYTKYNFSKSYSAINRFRTGTMPIVITDYTFCNTLSLAAPEIQGLWDMVPIPGTEDENGNIHREVAGAVSSCILFSSTSDPDASWEFLKWWTSKDTQVQYGREIEALQGPSARWPTANLEAMEELGWTASDAKVIQEQWNYVEGIAEVPGGYYVGRSVDNAIKSVINLGKNARETLLDAVDDINEEILNKRQEFGLE